MAVSAQNEGGLEDGGGSHVLYVLCSVILTTPELDPPSMGILAAAPIRKENLLLLI